MPFSRPGSAQPLNQTSAAMIGGALVALLMIGGCAPPAETEQVVNVYSARHYDTDLRLYERFEELTGVRVALIEGNSDALTARIKDEGEFSPADMLITVDAGRLTRAKDAGVLQPIESTVLSSRVPAHLRDPDGQWFGLSKRARVIVYRTDKGLPPGITDYEHLADPRLKGRICMRSSSNIYNLSLMGSLIQHLGAEAAEQWASAVVANFARPPQGNDRAQIRAVAAGECDVTIANTYYIARMISGDDADERAAVAKVSVLFPNQSNRGTHVNISGAGVTLHAPNRDHAIRFLEYLTSDFAQNLFAEGNHEYQVVGETTGPVAALGSFVEDELNATVLGANQANAVKIFDRAGWP